MRTRHTASRDRRYARRNELTSTLTDSEAHYTPHAAHNTQQCLGLYGRSSTSTVVVSLPTAAGQSNRGRHGLPARVVPQPLFLPSAASGHATNLDPSFGLNLFPPSRLSWKRLPRLLFRFRRTLVVGLAGSAPVAMKRKA
jgi:hypothetical protein